MIQLFACDLDGTLLLNGDELSGGVSPENFDAVQLLHKNNVRFLMASGREHHYRRKLEKQFGFQIDAIGMNGCCVMVDEKLVSYHTLQKQDVLDLMAASQELPFFMNVMSLDVVGNHIFTMPDRYPFSMFKDFEANGDMTRLIDEPLSSWLENPANAEASKIVGIVDDPSNRDLAIDFLRKRFDRRFDILFSGPFYIEIMPKNVSKGNALLDLMKAYNYKPENVAVIGDSMNDISMMKVTPYSFAMSHAEERVQKHANYIVKSVAEAVKIVLKLNEGNHAEI